MVIMSIHQPRYSIFKLFDSLTLLSEGKLVYHGPPDQSIQYFGRLGKVLVWVEIIVEPHYYVSVFFLLHGTILSLPGFLRGLRGGILPPLKMVLPLLNFLCILALTYAFALCLETVVSFPEKSDLLFITLAHALIESAKLTTLH